MANKNKNSLQYNQNLYVYRGHTERASHFDEQLDAQDLAISFIQGSEHRVVMCLLWDNVESIESYSKEQCDTLVLPRQLLERRIRQIEPLLHQPLAMPSIVHEYFMFLMSHRGSLENQFESIFIQTFLDVFVESLNTDKVIPTSKHRRELLQSIKNYIESNIRNPALNPSMIAQAFSISTRYVHDLFKAEGMTVSHYILDTRLEKCRRNLVRVHREKKKVIDIAFKWGFNDAAYFSKVFKKRYGVAPSKYEE